MTEDEKTTELPEDELNQVSGGVQGEPTALKAELDPTSVPGRRKGTFEKIEVDF